MEHASNAFRSHLLDTLVPLNNAAQPIFLMLQGFFMMEQPRSWQEELGEVFLLIIVDFLLVVGPFAASSAP